MWSKHSAIKYCYHMPGPLDSFIDDFILLINDLKLNTGFLLLVILILVKYCLSMLILQFKILSCLSIHNIQLIYIVSVFDTSNYNIVSSLPSPHSNHFVLLFQIWCIIFKQNLAVSNLAFNPHDVFQRMVLIC